MKTNCWGLSVVLLLSLGVSISSGLTVYFPEMDISGVAGEGIMASAEAEVTSGSGYIDVLLKNTSPLGPALMPNKIANPFIMEIEIVFASGLTLNEGSSYVSSSSDTYFAQGKTGKNGNPAVQFGVRNLDYKFVAPDSHGMDACFMTDAEADNFSNNNTVGSMDVLDTSYRPQEDYAEGFLNTAPDQYSGAVFDSALFHFVFYESVTPDVSLYSTPSTLYVKYVGGGDYSIHAASVPEPSTVSLLGLGTLALLRRTKR